jgi:subtilisin family serine protease
LTKIGAPTAWATSTGNGTVIAIIDTGVDGTHADLAAQMVPGWNFYDNNSDARDVNGHGTAVAGTAAAAGNNAIGVASIAWRARLMPIRISDSTGFAYWSTIAQGVTWAADHGARVANISYAVGSSSAVQSAAQYMRSKGGVVVVSAGNNGVAESTAPSDTMIIVSATDSTDVRTSWSSYGSFVDLAAPGYNIYTTVRGGGYGYWWGTSFAAPIVSGVAALVKSLRPDFSAAQVESTLFSSALDLGAVGKDTVYGWGRVSASNAVARTIAAPVDTTPPSVAISTPAAGGTVQGSVTVNVSATDNVGVVRVDLKVNGLLVGSDTVAPYSFVWNSATVANGSATLTAVAFDGAGSSATSSPVTVTVANVTSTQTIASTSSPTVAITSPADGSKVGNGKVSISGTASAPAGLTSVKLSIDGTVVATGNTAALSYSWDAHSAAAGSHTISLWAQDAAGQTSSRSITVKK